MRISHAFIIPLYDAKNANILSHGSPMKSTSATSHSLKTPHVESALVVTNVNILVENVNVGVTDTISRIVSVTGCVCVNVCGTSASASVHESEPIRQSQSPWLLRSLRHTIKIFCRTQFVKYTPPLYISIYIVEKLTIDIYNTDWKPCMFVLYFVSDAKLQT